MKQHRRAGSKETHMLLAGWWQGALWIRNQVPAHKDKLNGADAQEKRKSGGRTNQSCQAERAGKRNRDRSEFSETTLRGS